MEEDASYGLQMSNGSSSIAMDDSGATAATTPASSNLTEMEIMENFGLKGQKVILRKG